MTKEKKFNTWYITVTFLGVVFITACVFFIIWGENRQNPYLYDCAYAVALVKTYSPFIIALFLFIKGYMQKSTSVMVSIIVNIAAMIILAVIYLVLKFTLYEGGFSLWMILPRFPMMSVTFAMAAFSLFCDIVLRRKNNA